VEGTAGQRLPGTEVLYRREKAYKQELAVLKAAISAYEAEATPKNKNPPGLAGG